LPQTHAEAVATHWARLRNEKPEVYNGRVLLMRRWALAPRIDGGLKFEGDYFEATMPISSRARRLKPSRCSTSVCGMRPLAIKTMPLARAPPRKQRFGGPLALSKVHWVKPELVAEITYLRHGEILARVRQQH
jgi:hypothetical protein